MMSDPQRDPVTGDRPVQAQVEEVMDRHVTPALGEVVGQAEMVLQDGVEELRHQLERLSETVRAQPLTSIAIAALTGFVLARLTER
jgi:ElaB/YqjD/DUF883 family membrane-anchored ribosome-binding protein